MPLALLLAFAASLGLHAAVLFGTQIENVEPEPTPILAERRPLERPPPAPEAPPAKPRRSAKPKAKPAPLATDRPAENALPAVPLELLRPPPSDALSDSPRLLPYCPTG